MLVRTRVSQETVFISTGSATSGGIVFVNKKGAVTQVKVNEASIINYINNQLVQLANRQDIAFTLARRFGLPGADELFTRQFQQLFASGDYKGVIIIIVIMIIISSSSIVIKVMLTLSALPPALPCPGITLHHITLRHIMSHYDTLHYITLHYITLHSITLRYITLHYVASGAATVAAQCKSGALRSPQTIEMFKSVQVVKQTKRRSINKEHTIRTTKQTKETKHDKINHETKNARVYMCIYIYIYQ